MRRFVSIGGILALLLIVVGIAGTAHDATAGKPSGGANLADPTNVNNT